MSIYDPILAARLSGPQQELQKAQSNLASAKESYNHYQTKYIEYRNFKSDLDALISRLENAMSYLETALENKKAGYSSGVVQDMSFRRIPGMLFTHTFCDEIEYLYAYTEDAKSKIEAASESAEKIKNGYKSLMSEAERNIDIYNNQIENLNSIIARIMD